MAHGRLLLTATMDEIKQRLSASNSASRAQPRTPPGSGTVLERNGVGRLWQAVIQDPVAEAVEALRAATAWTNSRNRH